MVILLNEEYREYFAYLDEMRKGGETNMFGVAPFLAAEFDLDRSKARQVLMDWMNLFSARSGEFSEYADLDRADMWSEIMVDRWGTEVKPKNG